MPLERRLRRTLPAAFALTVLAGLPLARAEITSADVERLAAERSQRLIEWRRDIHQHPELGNREQRTSKLVAAHLRSLGLDVRTGIATTGVAAVLKGGRPGPVIALRADMDALPVTERTDVPFKSTVKSEYRVQTVGVMHACGHDSHTAILMAAAQSLASVKAQLPGTILFIFQPAEEGVPDGEKGGAKEMLAQGLFDIVKPEAVFGLHVFSILHTGDIGYRSGPFMAGSDSFRIVVTGKQTHGAVPWQGTDPIVAAAQIVEALQTVVSRQVNITENPAIVTVGAINGGIRNNIIPDQVELLGTIRTFSKEQRALVFERVERVAKNTAAATGASATFTVGEAPYPVTFNDPALTQRVLPSLQKVIGAEHTKEIPLVTGAEDFSFFGERVPAFYFFVGVTPPDRDLATAPANHSPLFYIDEAALQPALRALMQVTVDYLQGGKGS